MRAVRRAHSSGAGLAVSDVGPYAASATWWASSALGKHSGVIVVHTGKTVGESQYVYHRIVEPKMLLVELGCRLYTRFAPPVSTAAASHAGRANSAIGNGLRSISTDGGKALLGGQQPILQDVQSPPISRFERTMTSKSPSTMGCRRFYDSST